MSNPKLGFSQEVTNKRTLILDADPRFDIHDDSALIPVKNIASSSQVLELSAQSSSIDNYQFNYSFDTTNFVNSGITFRLVLPLKFVLTTALAAKATKDDFVEKVFKNFSHLALRQHGILSIIQDWSLTLNNMTYNVQNANKLAPIFNYYEDDDVNGWMEASQRDRYQDYEAYVGNDDFTKYSVVSPNGSNESVAIPVKVGSNEENIFLGGFKDGYNTRTPLMTFVKMDDDLKTCHVKVTLEQYLPFGQLSLPGSDLSFYGVRNFGVNIRLLTHHAAAHLFSLAQRQSGTVAPFTNSFDFSSIELDTSVPVDTTRSKLLVPFYNAPEYIREEMIDPATGNPKSYAFGFTKVELQQPIECKLLEGGTTTVHLPVNPLGTVPRGMYIYALRKKDFNSSITVANTTSTFARLDGLQVNFNDQHTQFPQDALGLYSIAKSNGLHMDRLSAMYTSGFPLKLETQKDLSSGSSVYVGLARRCPVSMSVRVQDLRKQVGSGQTEATYEILVAYTYDAYVEHFNGSFDVKDSLLMDISGFSDRKYHIDFYNKRLRRVTQIGGFWGTVWRGIKSGARAIGSFLKNNPKILNSLGSAIDPSLGNVGDMASSLLPGAGYNSNSHVGGGTSTLGAGSVQTTTFRNKTTTPFKNAQL